MEHTTIAVDLAKWLIGRIEGGIGVCLVVGNSLMVVDATSSFGRDCCPGPHWTSACPTCPTSAFDASVYGWHLGVEACFPDCPGIAMIGPKNRTGDWSSPIATRTLTCSSTWISGINRVGLHFEWAMRPSDIGPSGDTRMLSAALDVFRFRVAP